jgi:hypothetical protein
VATSATQSPAPVPAKASPKPAAGAKASGTPPRASALSLLASSRLFQSGWSVSAVFAGVAVIVGACSYFAGLQSASLQVAQLTSQLERMQKDAGRGGTLAQAVVLPVSPSVPGAAPATPNAGVAGSAGENVRRLEAQNTQYHTLLDRQDAEHSAGRSLLAVLAVAHSSLIPLQAAKPGAHKVVAYLLTAPGGRFVFVASSLPSVAAGHQYQLWFFRKDDPSPLRGPVFDIRQPTAIDLNQVLPAGISSLQLTEEPSGGSDAPSSPPVATCSLQH